MPFDTGREQRLINGRQRSLLNECTAAVWRSKKPFIVQFQLRQGRMHGLLEGLEPPAADQSQTLTNDV